MPRKWAQERQTVIQAGIERFKEEVERIKADPRWRAYADRGLRDYDFSMAVMAAADKHLRGAYRQSKALSEEARRYCEALVADVRKSLADYTNPSQFGAELLIHDREVESRLALARTVNDVLRAFEDGTAHTGNKAQKYAWVRNMDRALQRIEALAQAEAKSHYWGGEAEERHDAEQTLRTASVARGRLEELAERARAEIFPKTAVFEEMLQEAAAELESNHEGTHEYERRLLAATFQSTAQSTVSWWGGEVSDEPTGNEVLAKFAENDGGLKEWLESA